jgi:hypothetical protein
MMNTNDLIAHARARFDHAAARRILKEKYAAKMLFAYNGGMWRAGPDLLTLLQAVPVEDDVVLLDLYENPVKINPAELRYLALGRWQEQMTAWLIEHDEMSRKR